jgi:Fe-S cluster biogenesis protein NfuA
MKSDAPFYTEEELDALYVSDPVLALRISREQAELQRRLAAAVDPNAPSPTAEGVRAVLQEVRSILLRDGGDLEFVALEDDVLTVRLKGNCVGCPRATLDLKNVVERMVRNRYPRISAVRNIF